MTTAATGVQLTKISMFILYVRDTMASLPFYRDVLGMKVLESSPHWLELDAGSVHLALHPHPKMPDKREETLPWVVFPVEDVQATYETLQAKGVVFLCPPKEVCGDEKMVGLSADLEDPDGNRLSLFSMVPRA